MNEMTRLLHDVVEACDTRNQSKLDASLLSIATLAAVPGHDSAVADERVDMRVQPSGRPRNWIGDSHAQRRVAIMTVDPNSDPTRGAWQVQTYLPNGVTTFTAVIMEVVQS